ncbi:hypothetical protein E2C01_033030 [Portunus trituberculatus]|uniref:Uncharacterized protein n=1 Tax=Portunus trituberculatus TaxID=210409 RepID=A0A5B7EZ30_PORTR|nr:hypothetical protein [Portunus trituberculatus]
MYYSAPADKLRVGQVPSFHQLTCSTAASSQLASARVTLRVKTTRGQCTRAEAQRLPGNIFSAFARLHTSKLFVCRQAISPGTARQALQCATARHTSKSITEHNDSFLRSSVLMLNQIHGSAACLYECSPLTETVRASVAVWMSVSVSTAGFVR